MARNYTAARPYAHAIFEHARAAGDLPLWAKVLDLLSQSAMNEQLNRLIANPKVTDQQVLAVLMSVCHANLQQVSESFWQQVENFLKMIAQYKRFSLLPEIQALYHELLMSLAEVIDVNVTAANTLSAQQQQRLAQALERRLDSKVKINYASNKDLIGGAIIRVGNWIMDGSVMGALGRLKEQLASN